MQRGEACKGKEGKVCKGTRHAKGQGMQGGEACKGGQGVQEGQGL